MNHLEENTEPNSGSKIFRIRLKGIYKIVDFVKATNKIPCDIDIKSGRYFLDAKSVMGLFSIDVSKDILLYVHTREAESLNIVRTLLKEYIVEEYR